MFSDQQAAYEALSPTMQAFLGTLTAMHDGRPSFQGLLDRVGEGKWNGEKVVALEPTEHPVIRTHPETGKKTIFVNGGFTTHIVGLERDESDALLRFLYRHCTQPHHRALPLARRRRRVLGQPLDATQGGRRLRRRPPGDPTRHPARRRAFLTPTTASSEAPPTLFLLGPMNSINPSTSPSSPSIV